MNYVCAGLARRERQYVQYHQWVIGTIFTFAVLFEIPRYACPVFLSSLRSIMYCWLQRWRDAQDGRWSWLKPTDRLRSLQCNQQHGRGESSDKKAFQRQQQHSFCLQQRAGTTHATHMAKQHTLFICSHLLLILANTDSSSTCIKLYMKAVTFLKPSSCDRLQTFLTIANVNGQHVWQSEGYGLHFVSVR